VTNYDGIAGNGGCYKHKRQELNCILATRGTTGIFLKVVTFIHVSSMSMLVNFTSVSDQWCTKNLFRGVVYARIFFGRGVKEIQLRAEVREKGDWGR
jgi:hypothetical protein